MTIRPEAIRAAELAARDVFNMWTWAELDHNESREFFTGILEAAAPYMQAEAWDKGYKMAMFDKEYYSHNRNPYRPTNAG